MSSPVLRVNEEALFWVPAEVTAPPVPTFSPGADPMSLLVADQVPKVTDPVLQDIAAARALEDTFNANLAAARNAYGGTDSAGQQQIRSAAESSGLGDSGSSADSAVSTSSGVGAANGGAGSDGLAQLMAMAAPAAQQAVQIPMQAVGMAGQMVQPVMQGVQGIVQQASQANDKGGPEGQQGAGGQNGTPGGTDGASERTSELAERDSEDRHAKPDNKDPEEHDKKDSPTAGGPGSGQAHRAPIGEPQNESPSPAEAPRHRRLTETSPEVVL